MLLNLRETESNEHKAHNCLP